MSFEVYNMENKMDKSDNKMPPEQLEKWLALRKKCHVHKDKKAYNRKKKHKKKEKDLETD